MKYTCMIVFGIPEKQNKVSIVRPGTAKLFLSPRNRHPFRNLQQAYIRWQKTDPTMVNSKGFPVDSRIFPLQPECTGVIDVLRATDNEITSFVQQIREIMNDPFLDRSFKINKNIAA